MCKIVALLAVTVTLIGCSGPEVRRITGSVLVDGLPGEEIGVTFWPRDDIRLGMMAAYHLEEDGTFDIVPRVEQGQGRAGTYNVLIQDTRASAIIRNIHGHQPGKSAPSTSRPRRGNLPAIYADRQATPLTVDIEPGENHLEPIEIDSQPLEGVLRTGA